MYGERESESEREIHKPNQYSFYRKWYNMDKRLFTLLFKIFSPIQHNYFYGIVSATHVLIDSQVVYLIALDLHECAILYNIYCILHLVVLARFQVKVKIKIKIRSRISRKHKHTKIKQI